jgi:hypothetical protein
VAYPRKCLFIYLRLRKRSVSDFDYQFINVEWNGYGITLAPCWEPLTPFFLL